MTPSLTIAPLLSLALLASGAVLLIRRSQREGRVIRPTSFVWLGVPGLCLIAAAVWCASDLYTGGAAELCALCLAALLCGAVVLSRDRLLGALEGLADRAGLSSRALSAVVAALALALATLLGFLAMELPYSDEIAQMVPQFAALQAALIAGALLMLYFLFQRRGSGIAVGVGVCAFIGLSQFFVASFKASAILPNDLFVLGTAAAVSGSYVYSVDGAVLLGFACLLVAVAACSLVRPVPLEPGQGAARRAVGNVAAAVLCALALGAGVTVPSYFDDLGVGMEYWYTLDYYRKQGFLTTFIAVAQDLPVDVPEGYTDDGARELEAARAATYDETLGAEGSHVAAAEQFSELRPSVICVMNETFADLTCLDGASWGYEGPQFVRSLADEALVSGDTAVSVIGGGTCNSEFEFLTGVPMAYVGDGKYPYSLYDLSEAPSLAREFSELGYDTTAMHPNFATNWNRDRVYEAMGFDQFLSYDAFDGAEWFHSGVSDAETYDKVLQILRDDPDPQLVFDVTMQNHSSYDQGNIGAVTQYEVDGVSDYDNGRLSEYLACVEESDRALAEFVAELSELDRPVVLVFFGDHQPALSTIVNDALYPDEADELAHNLRTHATPYFVWANYDVAGAQPASDELTSPAYLAAVAKQVVGAPLTDFQKAQLVAREDMPAVSLVGTCRADGTWVAADDESGQPGAYDDLAQISYLEFASKLE